MDYVNLLLSALFGSIIGASVHYYFTRRTERIKQYEEKTIEIYHMLCDLYQKHFWICSNEVRPMEPEHRIQIAKDFGLFRWKIADALRLVDRIPEAEKILYTIFSLSYKSERERANDLKDLCDQLGARVNPKFIKILKKIGAEDEKLMVEDVEEYLRRRGKIEFP